MWVLLAAIALILAGGVAQAQSADESESGLESCFRAALAIAVCSEQSNNPEQRVECLAKARADQLDCIKETLSASRNKPPENSSKTGSAPAASGAAPQAPGALKAPAPVDSVGSIPAVDATGTERPDRTPKSAPELREANKPPSKSPEPSGAMRPDRTPEPTPEPRSANKPPSMALEPSAMRPETSGKRDNAPMPQPDWIVSETTSPLDYSPLISAVIHSTAGEKDSPSSLAVRCRAQRTEVSLGTNGAWGVPRGNVIQVDYQIDDRPRIRQQWILTADGRTATYKGDAAELLRSIPDGAALKVAVADKDNIRREALFQLAGLSAIRQKVAAACKWTPATASTSTDGR